MGQRAEADSDEPTAASTQGMLPGARDVAVKIGGTGCEDLRENQEEQGTPWICIP